MGWNALREQIYANQKRLGVIPSGTALTPWPDVLPKWETLSAEEKKLFARQAEVFAAYVAYTDHEIGRVIQAVDDLGKLDNTLIIYIEGDNGTSAEGTTIGTPNVMTGYQGVPVPVPEQMKFYDVWGSAKTAPHMSVAWSWAFDTPFKWTKQVASHFGGTRQGMAIAWPSHIKDAGGIRTQFHHMIDIVPTILEATGIQAPVMVNGIAQKPIQGASMAYTWPKENAEASSKRTTQYFEMFGNRAIYHDGWIAATTPPSPPWELGLGKLPKDVVNGYKWELYNIAEDYSENDDLAAKMPDKLRELQELFLVEADKYNVFPMDNTVIQRALTPRPSATAGRDVFTYSGEILGLDPASAPSILNKSYTITAEVEIPQGGGEGMKLIRKIVPLAVAVISLTTVVACWFTLTQAQEASAAPRLASQKREPPNQPENMVWIPGGEFWMGGPSKSQSLQAANDVRPGLTVCRGLVEGFSDAEPQVRVHVDGFWMDKTVVTNEEFAKFAEATVYITAAERQPIAEQFPAAPPENLVPGSACFYTTESPGLAGQLFGVVELHPRRKLAPSECS